MNKISIAHIGLSKKDQLLFRNLCQLTNTVMGQFQLLEKNNSSQGDMLLIDVEAPEAEKHFGVLKTFKQFNSIIAITQADKELPSWISNARALTRPTVLRKTTAVFEEVLNNNQIESNSSKSQHAILVVDDALPVRTFMKQRLHDLLGNSIAVDLATSGEQGLQLAQNNHYELIFLDVVMPDIDGYQVCREIKSKHKTPVVMLTGKSSTLNKVKAKLSGCNGYITKPPKDSELIAEITRFMPRAIEEFSNVNPLTV